MSSPASWDRMRALVAKSKIDKFYVMDTYYFTLSRYLDALDWHVANFPVEKLSMSVAMSIVNPLKGMDEYIARIHALHKTPVKYLSIFRIPVNDEWLEWIKRWKAQCVGCPGLAC